MRATLGSLLALAITISCAFCLEGSENESTTTTTPFATTTSEPRESPVPKETTEPPVDFNSTIWECPNITKAGVECSCDFPHTLRCTGDRTALRAIGEHLRHDRPGTISLLDVTVAGITALPARFLEGVALHGLVVSSGELRRVHEYAFTSLARPLQALGLPNNLLDSIPTVALSRLVGLDRLDLSHNRLKTLEADSFEGLANLTYLDLCDNLLSQLSPQAFAALPSLRVLRMRGNRLSVSALSALRGLSSLEELDLSGNLLRGPLGPGLLPRMPRLRYLTVSENELVNVQQGALAGLNNLSILSLSHNQIDVLEDHSFEQLSTLTRLDLASNRIVAVSSASLAHLEKLTALDLTHNFLRSLTADLVVPLSSLQDLRLDDNDITMVSSEVPTSKLRLKRLSLSDNPLNCDCTLLDFANWLTNSSLSDEDKSSAVCATPPALENGILAQVSPGSLLCGEPTPSVATKPPLAGSRLTLDEFRYDQATGIDLLWRVEPCTERYTCDTLIVYETVGDSEVQMDSSPLHCDSSTMRDPCFLPVAIPASLRLQPGHRYRYCVVLLVPTAYDDALLGLGCSDVMTLEETEKVRETVRGYGARITGVRANVSDGGSLRVDVTLSTRENRRDSTVDPDCQLSLVVFDEDAAVHRRRTNCSLAFDTVELLAPGRYKVCASLDPLGDEDIVAWAQGDGARSRCVDVRSFGRNTRIVIALAVAVASCAFLVALAVVVRTLAKRLGRSAMQAQCFLPAQEFEITHKARYIKLLATTKV